MNQTRQQCSKKPSREEMFWRNVNKTNGCWNWTGGKSSGYGWLSKERIRTHRYSYILANGNIPDGLFVCHKCDNKLCVRPDHLFLGTRSDNMQDASKKGRLPQQSGEFSGRHRLTNEIVSAIRCRYDEGLSIREIADQFGLKNSHVCNIVNGKRWPHLPLGKRHNVNSAGEKRKKLLLSTIKPSGSNLEDLFTTLRDVYPDRTRLRQELWRAKRDGLLSSYEGVYSLNPNAAKVHIIDEKMLARLKGAS